MDDISNRNLILASTAVIVWVIGADYINQFLAVLNPAAQFVLFIFLILMMFLIGGDGS